MKSTCGVASATLTCNLLYLGLFVFLIFYKQHRYLQGKHSLLLNPAMICNVLPRISVTNPFSVAFVLTLKTYVSDVF